MKKLRLIVYSPHFSALEKNIISHAECNDFEIVAHKAAINKTLDSHSDLYLIELNDLSGRLLHKNLEEKKLWSIVIIKDSSFFREVVSSTHTICLYPQFTTQELHNVITKILALLKSQNEVARPVLTQQLFNNPLVSQILTKREQEMLADIRQGKMYKEIAHTKGITIGTVKQHIHKIYNKMHVSNKIEALNLCRMGL